MKRKLDFGYFVKQNQNLKCFPLVDQAAYFNPALHLLTNLTRKRVQKRAGVFAFKLKLPPFFSLIYSGPLIIIDSNYPPKPGIFLSVFLSWTMPLTDAVNGTENCLLRCHREIVCIFSPRILNLCTFPILENICSRPDMDKSQLFTVGHDRNTQPPIQEQDLYKYTYRLYLHNIYFYNVCGDHFSFPFKESGTDMEIHIGAYFILF